MISLTEKYYDQWSQGTANTAYNYLGGHPVEGGVRFRVWAPHACEIQVVGDFNNWKAGHNTMRPLKGGRFWETKVAAAAPGDCYKYAVTGAGGTTVLKADPFAFYAQEKSYHASLIYAFPGFEWQDQAWLEHRKICQRPNQPLSIYEVHLGSWRRNRDGSMLSYKQLADQLIPYVKEMGFTHIELLPVMEHPYTPSWGYQITGYFAPTARYGQPHDFMVFIDACHRQGIGVIMDWVPGHFPKDEHGLAFFDGTPLFEHADPRRRDHADWGTHNFDLDKPQVRSFLLSNAHFWCEKYHIDGFRMDAVASMLYLDYSKEGGDWLPNLYGGRENTGAVAFLQDCNKLIGERFPGVLTIAEESTAWPGVTAPVTEGGLGFDYKWNMGWMNDTLHYFNLSPQKRAEDSHSITFPRTFAFSEHFILPFSHDEVVHLKESLWSKMPGNSKQKFAQLRLLFLYMIGCPGKKLLFMGSELAQKEEWSASGALNWQALNQPENKAVQEYLKALLALYRSEPALFETDDTEETFLWGDLSQKNSGVFSFSRLLNNQKTRLTFIFNFSDNKVDYCDVAGIETVQAPYFDTHRSLNSQKKEGQDSPSLWLQPFQGLIFKSRMV